MALCLRPRRRRTARVSVSVVVLMLLSLTAGCFRTVEASCALTGSAITGIVVFLTKNPRHPLSMFLLEGGAELLSSECVRVFETYSEPTSVDDFLQSDNIPAEFRLPPEGAVCMVDGYNTVATGRHKDRVPAPQPYTSCEFAIEVYESFFSQGERTGLTMPVRSPVTGQVYPMTCRETRTDMDVIVCEGGNQAVVYIY